MARFATLYVYTPQDAAEGGHVDPLYQNGPRKEPAMVGVKIVDTDDYDRNRWFVPEGDEYDGVIYDIERERWTEGPPPYRTYGFLIGEETLKEIGLMVKGKNLISRTKTFEIDALIEGAHPRIQ